MLTFLKIIGLIVAGILIVSLYAFAGISLYDLLITLEKDRIFHPVVYVIFWPIFCVVMMWEYILQAIKGKE